MANVGLAPREVRLVILTVGVVLAGVSLTVMAIALGLIVVLATISTIQRIVVTLRQASLPE
jgi:hypothetical protein